MAESYRTTALQFRKIDIILSEISSLPTNVGFVLSQDSLFQKLYLNLSELDLKLTQELFDRLQYNQGSCPHCHKPYVVEHSNKMDDGGRQYNFICRLCDHIEMATDENHEEIRDRWQMQPVFS